MTETVAASPIQRGEVRPKVMAEFRKHSGSTLGGFFGAATCDEVALVPVAAAVDKTGRFEANFADRGVRSGFSAFLAIWGDPPTGWPSPTGSNSCTATYADAAVASFPMCATARWIPSCGTGSR